MLLSGCTVRRLAQDVGVAAVPGQLLDHVKVNPAQRLLVPAATGDVVQRVRCDRLVGAVQAARYAATTDSTVSCGSMRQSAYSSSGV